ncbi:putative membrane protein [Asticcacaulis biprosthecium C19]|uniref:Putative membrane protein n=1 Tax=Asticcacaulis biprosthecium C19 TaxID=715226 RepID=F4QLH8_9CAUL|nr:putative membrane protein [Asticcacaulis biprosthecium C19]
MGKSNLAPLLWDVLTPLTPAAAASISSGMITACILFSVYYAPLP